MFRVIDYSPEAGPSEEDVDVGEGGERRLPAGREGRLVDEDADIFDFGLDNGAQLEDAVGPDIDHLLFEGVPGPEPCQLPFDFGKNS